MNLWGKPFHFTISVPILIAAAVLTLPGLVSSQEAPLEIHSIGIQGNKFVEESTIRFYLLTKPGDPFSVEKIREDIKRIYNLGFFTDVRVDVQPFEGELIVTFIVTEKPSIGEIRVTGNEEVKIEDMKEKLTIETGSILNQQAIQDSINSLKGLYEEKGFYFTEIDSLIEEMEGNQVAVEIRIQEGKKIELRRISFEGNRSLTASRLKKVMKSKEGTFFKELITLGSAGAFKKGTLAEDVERLKLFYRSMGFIQAFVSQPELKFDKEEGAVDIEITISEGDQYKVSSVKIEGDLEIEGDPQFTPEGLKKLLKIREGEIYNELQVREDILELDDLYSRRGYAFSDVFPQAVPDHKEREMKVTYRIDKGPQVYVGNINISGNTRTRDKVVRREIPLYEGEVFNSSKLEKARRNLENLQFFGDIKIDTDRVEGENLLDINVKVTEKQTGFISGGVGYSSVDLFILQGSVEQRNLFGKGQFTSLTGQLGGRRTDLIFSFVEPYFLDRKLSLGITLYNQDRELYTFDQKSLGGIVRIGWPATDTLSLSMGYRLDRTRLDDISPSARTIFRLPDVSRFTTSSIIPTITHDTTDSRVNPTRGFRNSLTLELAGSFLGGDNEFFKVVGDSRLYWTVPESVLPFRRKIILMLHEQLGYVDAFGDLPLPISERFYLGGPRTIRGFDFRDVGPLDLSGNPVGGVSSVLFNAELQFPLLSVLKGVIFFDAGNVFASDLEGETFLQDGVEVTEGESFSLTDLRYAVGLGVRINTPMGPLALDYGYNLDPLPFERRSQIHFDIGRRF